MESGKEFGIPHVLQRCSDVSDMVLKRLRKDKDVIEVHQDECIQFLLEQRVHHPLKRCWSICHTKRHDQKFELAPLRPKCGFGDVLLLHGYLMITGGQIERRKMLGLPQSVQKIINTQ